MTTTQQKPVCFRFTEQGMLRDQPEAYVCLDWPDMTNVNSSVTAHLSRFFTDIEAQVPDFQQMFSDPGELAAGFIAWTAIQLAQDPGKILGLGRTTISRYQPDDDEISHIYDVVSVKSGRPDVSHA